MATHCSILAWEMPWTEEPGGLQFTGPQKSETTERVDYHRACRGGSQSRLPKEAVLSTIERCTCSFFLPSPYSLFPSKVKSASSPRPDSFSEVVSRIWNTVRVSWFCIGVCIFLWYIPISPIKKKFAYITIHSLFCKILSVLTNTRCHIGTIAAPWE